MDLKEHLTNIISDVSNNNNNVNNVNNNINNSSDENHYTKKMEAFMNNTVINKYARNWSRLENKLKIKKIEEYVDTVSNEYSINKSNSRELLKCLISRLRQNRLNKLSEITYDKDTFEITDIKKLKLDTNHFEFTD